MDEGFSKIIQSLQSFHQLKKIVKSDGVFKLDDKESLSELIDDLNIKLVKAIMNTDTGKNCIQMIDDFNKTNEKIEIKVEMIKYIRLWQINQEFGGTRNTYTDQNLLNFLKIIKSEENISINKLIDSIPEKNIVEKLKGFMIIEPLKYSASSCDLADIEIVEFISEKHEFSKDRLIASKKYRSYLYTKQSHTFSVPFLASKNVLDSLHLILGENIDSYYKSLTTIEEIYTFIKIFEYLELSF